MKNKLATVSQNKSRTSFALYFCTAKMVDGEYTSVTLGDRIESGASPRLLAEKAIALGLTLVHAPSEKSEFWMKGTRQSDGSVHDPVLDWNGNLIRTDVRSAELMGA